MNRIFTEGCGHQIKDKLAAYWRELAFVMSESSTWSDRFVLVQHTIRFHLHNWLGRAADNSNTFSVELRIGGANTLLTLRPFSGDLFVLYEVLAGNPYHIAPSLLRPEDVMTIVDCGANIGITSLFFAARYPYARIFSVEPHPNNFILLKKNTAHVPRIIPIHACVIGRAVGTVRFTKDQAAWGNRISVGDDGILVPAMTPKELCYQYEISNIDLLKVDIEGAEEHVFQNGDFLSWTKHIIIELHGSYNFDRFQRDIAPYGFSALQPHPPQTYMITATRDRL
jgi:FkbM family methyltransferase